MEPRGLVLVVGSTGSGKSTTLASMIDHRNQHTTGHILTIEDPIEFLHRHKKSIVNQREVGLDTHGFHNALKNAMREAPDVILIGEILDQATMEAAIAFAEPVTCAWPPCTPTTPTRRWSASSTSSPSRRTRTSS